MQVQEVLNTRGADFPLKFPYSSSCVGDWKYDAMLKFRHKSRAKWKYSMLWRDNLNLHYALRPLSSQWVLCCHLMLKTDLPPLGMFWRKLERTRGNSILGGGGQRRPPAISDRSAAFLSASGFSALICCGVWRNWRAIWRLDWTRLSD